MTIDPGGEKKQKKTRKVQVIQFVIAVYVQNALQLLVTRLNANQMVYVGSPHFLIGCNVLIR